MSSSLLTMRLTDDNHEMLTSFVVWARSTSVVYLAVYETSKQGQLHIHMLFEPIKQLKSAWIQAFHKFFKNRWNGNKSYSCSNLKLEVDNFYIYCCKGCRFKPPDVMFTKLPDTDIDKYWKKYWEDKPIEEDKTLLKQTKKKTSIITWSQQVSLDIIKAYPDHTWSYCSEDVDVIFDFVLKCLGSTSKKLNAFILRDLVLGQLNAISNGQCSGLNKALKKLAFPELFGNA